MANVDTHIITLVGPMEDIERFAKDYEIVAGDRAAGEQPDMRLVGGCRGTQCDKCRVGVCDIELYLEVSDAFVDPVGVYRGWMDAYPTLRIDWRYSSDMGCRVGYIDETGDHCWNELESGNWVGAMDNIGTEGVGSTCSGSDAGIKDYEAAATGNRHCDDLPAKAAGVESHIEGDSGEDLQSTGTESGLSASRCQNGEDVTRQPHARDVCDGAVSSAPSVEHVDFQLTRAELLTLVYHHLNRHFAERLRAASDFDRLEEDGEHTFAWQRYCLLEKTLAPPHPIFDSYIRFRQAEVGEVERETRLRRAMAERESKRGTVDSEREETTAQSSNLNEEI